MTKADTPKSDDPAPAPKGKETPIAREWRTLHLWQIQGVRDLLVLAALLALVWLGHAARLVTVPMLVALLLAYLCEPLVKRMSARLHIHRGTCAALILALATLLIVIPAIAGIGFGLGQAIHSARELAANLALAQEALKDPAAAEKLPGNWPTIVRNVHEFAGEYLDEASDVDNLLAGIREWITTNVDVLGASALKTGGSAVVVAIATLSSIGTLLFQVAVCAFFFFFFSTGFGGVVEFWKSLIPAHGKTQVIELLKQMDAVIAGFVRGRLIICSVLCVVLSVLYALIGVPMPVAFGMLVGILTLVPYVSGIGIPLAILAMWLDPPASELQRSVGWIVLAPIGVFMVGQALDDYVMTPMVQGKQTNMDTPSIVFASLAGGALAGVYGLLLAIPVAACIKILWREVVGPRLHAWARKA